MYRVHGDPGEAPTAPWRSGPYPFPAVEHEPYIADLAERLRAQGVTPVSNAMGIDLQPGGTCIRTPTCDGFPCARGAKSDAETCAIDPALATGNARPATGVLVGRIATDGTGRRVSRLLADGPEGPLEVSGERFVLAAGAVNSAALLLASADEKHPRGLANGSDQVGRNLLMHNNAHIVAVDLNRRNDVVFLKTLGVSDWYLDGGDGYPLGSMQLIGKVQGVMMKTAAPRFVPLAVLNQVAGRSVEWLVMAEDLPSPENRVSVDSAGRIATVRTARGLSTHRRLLRRAKKLLRSAGYDAILTQHFDISMNSHQCGTVVAGADPATSVLDPWCKAHELENLWVVDGSFFPSSAAMNPALTIAAQALRVVAESDLATP
jgi:choline dehydrogenase-like flavoprotein